MAYDATWQANLKLRLRRMRLSKNMRRLVRETGLTSDDFIYPLFVRHGQDVKTACGIAARQVPDVPWTI